MKSFSNDIILGLDIGTSIIKATLGRILEDSIIELLASTQVKQLPGSMKNGAIVNIPSVITSCEKAITDIERISGERIKNTVVSIDGESIKCFSPRVHFTREHDKNPISSIEISAILEKVQFETGKKAQSIIATELDNPYAEISIVNSSLTHINIDGEDVENPIGFKGAEMDLEFYTAFAPKSQTEAIEQVCAELELNLLAISVAPFAACRAIIGDESPSNHASIVINIGEVCTSIAIIDNFGIRGTSTFAMGAHTLDTDPSIWLDGLSMTLSDNFHLKNLPSNIALIGGASGRNDIEESLALSDWYKDLPFDKRPLISIIDLSELPNISNPTHTALNPAYTTSIGLIRIAADIISSGQTESFLSKIIHH